MLAEMEKFLEEDERGEKYRSLDWNLEKLAADGDPDAETEILKRCLE